MIITQITRIPTGDRTSKIMFLCDGHNLETMEFRNSSIATTEDVDNLIDQTITSWQEEVAEDNLAVIDSYLTELEGAEID